jgi:hypothetical protein
MTHHPGATGGGYPINYNSGAFAPHPRPTSVSVISIFAIVLGSLGLMCNAISLVVQAILLTMHGGNPAFHAFAPMHNDSAVNAHNFVTGVISLLIAGALLAAGIGGLNLKPIARRGMLQLSVFIIFWATLTVIVQIAWLGPHTLARAQRLQASTTTSSAVAYKTGGEIGVVLGALFGWILFCALPICVLIFWRSPTVVSAFENASLQPPAGTPSAPNWPPPPGPLL